VFLERRRARTVRTYNFKDKDLVGMIRPKATGALERGMESHLDREAKILAKGHYDVVDDHILRFFPDLVEDMGGDSRSFLRQVNVDPESFLDGQLDTTYRQMVHLVELAARRLDCGDFGMRLAKLQASEIRSPLVRVMKNSRTFGEALEFAASHSFAHSLAAAIWMRRSRSGGAAMIGHDILLDRLPNRSQAMEQILLVAHLSALEVTGGLVRARKISFRHQPLSSLATYRHYFGCDVRFGQAADAIVYDERDFACPILAADRQAYEAATHFIDTHFPRRLPPLHAHIRGTIMHSLGTAECTAGRVAARLQLHPRSLQRRLEEEGTSFQRLKDEVRSDMMLYHLRQTDLDFARISEKLGFAEQSAMSRYCRKWFSVSPSQLRSQRGLLRAHGEVGALSYMGKS